MARSGALCCGQDPEENTTDDTDDILLVGLQGSGKTLLGQRLRLVHGKGTLRVATTETNGSQDFIVPTQRGCPVKHVRIRECGGSMQPLWRNWYSRPIKGVVFTVDISDAASLAASTVELYELLQHTSLLATPVCLVLTKADLPLPVSRPELELVVGLGELQRLHPGRLSVVTVSSVQTPQQCPALGELLEWMVRVKARALGIVRPAAAS